MSQQPIIKFLWKTRHMTGSTNTAHYIYLGSGEAERYSVSPKGTLLDFAAQSGLPVPPGILLLDEARQTAVAHGLLLEEDDCVCASDVDSFVRSLDLPPLGREVAVRSAFAAADRMGDSLAGYFTSSVNVNMGDPLAVTMALCQVWASALPHEETARRDVLMISMVDAELSGVVFSEADFADDVVNYTMGSSNKLVSGDAKGSLLRLPKLGVDGAAPSGALPAWAARLQALLRDIRRLCPGDWDAEWVDDGERCWLIQIRPTSRPARRDETAVS